MPIYDSFINCWYVVKLNNRNILLVANYPSDAGFSWGLMERFWLAISENFSAPDRKVFLIFPEVNRISKELKNAEITIIEFDFSKIRTKKCGEVGKFIREHKIGYIYMTSYPYYHINYIYLRSCGVRVQVNHDHSPGERPTIKGVKRVLKRLIVSVPGITCDQYIGVSRFVLMRLMQNACLPKNKCRYVLNGIAPYSADLVRTKYARDVFSIPEDHLIIVNTGRAHTYKRIDFVIECANVLINKMKHENITFLYWK